MEISTIQPQTANTPITNILYLAQFLTCSYLTIEGLHLHNKYSHGK